MSTIASTLGGQILLSLSVIFVAFVARDYFRAEGKLTPKRDTWIRIAIIFAAIPAALSLLQTFLR